MIFYLGAGELVWLERLSVPLFLSRNRAMRMAHKFPRARVPWVLDSGGFCEIKSYGRYRSCARDFALDAEFYHREIGGLQWAAPQDWMCEDVALRKSGLSIREHQERTIENYLELRSLPGNVRWVPVLQGWSIDDYLRHIDEYALAGINLFAEPTVGVGSICSRKQSTEAAMILNTLAAEGLAGRIHAFGLTARGLVESCSSLQSADSFAWSLVGRKRGANASDRNDASYALAWRAQLLSTLPPGCNQMHPALLGAEHAEFLRRASEGRRTRGVPGTMWGRELHHLVAEAGLVAHQNALLEQEEVFGMPRGSLFSWNDVFHMLPATHRAVLAEDTRRRLMSLKPNEWARVGTSQPIVQEALAYQDPGPAIAPDPYAAYEGQLAAAEWAVNQ